MLGFLQVRYADAKLGLLTPPSLASTRLIAPVFIAHALLSLAIVAVTGAIQWHGIRFGPLKAALLIAPLMINSLLEEIIYRGLLIPHPSRATSRASILTGCVLSVALYVVWHPIAARFIFGFQEHPFFQFPLLLVVAVLGAACAVAYRLTGSLWAGVAIHCATTAIWALGFL